MRFFLILILLLATGTFGVQLYRLLVQYHGINKEITILNKELEDAKKENQKLTADFDYFQKTNYLESELRKSGYAMPDEKMLIIIPEKK